MGLISECKWQRKEQWTWRQNNRNYPIWTTEKNILKKVYRASGMITEVLTSVVLSFLGRRTLSTCGNFSQYWVLSNAWAIIASGMAWCKQNAAILPSPLKKKFFFSFFVKVLGSPDGSAVKKKYLPAKAGDTRDLGLIPVWSLGQEDPLEKEMATHYSILAWEIPWTEKPGRLSPQGRKKLDTT